jgi:eukaryotic-like serine/threonine-protein kinase
VGRLGAGSMGVVFVAEDRERGGLVALKHLHWTDGEHLYRLKAEFRGLRGIAHRNLVQLHDLVITPRGAFFTMELLDGVDLVRHARRGATARGGGALNNAETQALRGLLRQLVEGIAALHQAGRLHRDLKATNVLVTRSGRAVLLDFGLSAALTGGQGTEEDRLVGTIATMAPEQSLGMVAGPAADWYALGAVLYEVLTGTQPFGGTLVEALAAKQIRDVTAPVLAAPGTAADLSQLAMSLLRPDPRTRPGPVESLAIIGVSSPELQPHPPRNGTVLSREAERSALDGALAAVAPGRPGVVEVVGGPGMGSTTFVGAWTEDVDESGRGTTLATRCDPRESIPFRALDGLVDGVSRRLMAEPAATRAALSVPGLSTLRGLFPVLSSVPDLAWGATLPPREAPLVDGPIVRRDEAAGALRVLLGVLARDRPLVLWIDDARWGDADSAWMLRTVLNHEDAPSVMLVLSGPAPSPGPLRAVLDTAGGTFARVVLRPLSTDQARTLVAARLGGEDGASPAGPRVARLAAAGGGVPLHLDLLLEHAPPGAPPSIGAAVQHMMRGLPPRTRRLVATVAVAPAPVPVEVASVAARLGAAAPQIIARALAGRLVRLVTDEGEPSLAPTDGVLKGAVISALAAEEADPIRTALEAAEAAFPATERHPLATAEAAEAAEAAGASHLAAALYARALRGLDSGAPERCALLARHGAALAAAGRPAEAATIVSAAADALTQQHPEDPSLPELRRAAAELALRAGHIEEGIARLEQVLSHVGLTWPKTPFAALRGVIYARIRLRARGLDVATSTADPPSPATIARADTCWTAAVGLSWVDGIRAAAFQSQYALIALDLGEPGPAARALATEAAFLGNQGGSENRAKVKTVGAAARSMAAQVDDPFLHAIVDICASAAAFFEADFEGARDHASRAEAGLDQAKGGLRWERLNCQVFALWSRAWLGDLSGLRRQLEHHLATAHEHGNLLAAATLSLGLPSLAWLAEDRPDLALARADDAMALWSHHAGFHTQHYMNLVSRVQVDLYRADGARAWARVQDTWPEVKRAQMLRPQHVRIDATFLRARAGLAALASAQKPGAIRRRVRADIRALRSEDAPWASILADTIAGALAQHEGDLSLARTTLHEALTQAQDARLGLLAAAIGWRLGELAVDDADEAVGEQAGAWLAAQDVIAPARLSRVLLPWPCAAPPSQR